MSNRLYYSVDKGLNFNYAYYLTEKYKTSSGWFFSVNVHKGILYTGHSSNGLFYSQDTGKSWTKMEGGIDRYPFIKEVLDITFDDDNNIWVGTVFGGPYLSTNNGNSWARADTLGPMNPITVMNPMFNVIVLDTLIFVNTQNSGVIKSDNTGKSWSYLNKGTPSFWSSVVWIKEFNKDIYSAGYGGEIPFGYLEVCKLNKEKNEWEEVWKAGTYENPNEQPIDLVMCGEVIYHLDVLNDKGITYSSDNGKTFKSLNYGLEDYIEWYYSNNFVYDSRCTLFRSLFTDGEYLFLTTCADSEDKYSRLYRLKLENCLPVLTSTEEIEIKSFPPYPNPAAGIITFELPEGSGLSGSYEVYNELGEKFSPSGELGAGKLSLDASSLPIGVYVLKYVSGSRLISEKFVVRR